MKKYCDKCGKENEAIIKVEERKYKIKGIEVKAKINVTYCKLCGEEIYNRKEELKNDIILFDAYKKKMNLLTSKEIRDIRITFDISQEALAKLLGFGLKTIARYENGSIQDETHDTILKIIKHLDSFKNLYFLKKDKLNENEKIKIEKRLEKLENKPIGIVFEVENIEKYQLENDAYLFGFENKTYGGDYHVC